MIDPLTIYRNALLDSKLCLDYLAERHVSLGVASVYGVGYAIDNQFSGYFGRMVFPIRTFDGEVLAFQGRAMFDYASRGEPKYWHGAYEKGSTVYGLYESGSLIAENNIAVITEGPFDVMACYTDGIPSIACLGTAMSLTQMLLLRRWTSRVMLWMDNDESGQRSMNAMRKLLKRADLEEVPLPYMLGRTGCKDAGEVLEKFGPGMIKEYLKWR